MGKLFLEEGLRLGETPVVVLLRAVPERVSWRGKTVVKCRGAKNPIAQTCSLCFLDLELSPLLTLTSLPKWTPNLWCHKSP